MVLFSRKSSGLTIVESLIATVVLATAFVALLNAVMAGQQQLHQSDIMLRAAQLGNDLLEEIVSRDYRDPAGGTSFGPETGENARCDYNDVDDYNGYSEPAGQLTDCTGRIYGPEHQVFSRSVSVTASEPLVSQLGCSIRGLNVTVTIRHQNGEQWQFTRFIPEPH